MSWGIAGDLPDRPLTDQELDDVLNAEKFDEVVAEQADTGIDQLYCRVGLMEYVLKFSGERWEEYDVRTRAD